MWWNRIKWLILIIFRKNPFYLAKIGAGIIFAALTPLTGVSIEFAYQQFGLNVDQCNTEDYILKIIVTLLGVYLIYLDTSSIRKNARRTSLVLIKSMLGTSSSFPDEVLSKYEKIDSREPVELGLEEGENYLEKSIDMFNSEKKVDIYNRFILHHNCKTVFLGGRARVPFLVAYGSCFRNNAAKIFYYDQIHQDGKWSLLDEEDEQIALQDNDVTLIQPNEKGEIGVALGFTTPVELHQLPDDIQNNTLFIEPTVPQARNLIKNQDNLERISAQLKLIIDRLSSKANCRTIHLFLSVQVSMALELGRDYQEGTHKQWVIYNYEPNTNQGKGGYAWAIKLMPDGTIDFKE